MSMSDILSTPNFDGEYLSQQFYNNKAIIDLKDKLESSNIPHKFLTYPTGRYHIEFDDIEVSVYEGEHYCTGDEHVALSGKDVDKIIKPNKEVYYPFTSSEAFNIICTIYNQHKE